MFIPTSLGDFPLHLKSSDADLQKGHLFEIRILGSFLTGFFVRNPSKSLQGKCGTRDYCPFENEFQPLENEIYYFQEQISSF